MASLTPATREQVRLRMLLIGATGAGKTCTAFRFATAIARRYGGRIGIIDTQHKQSRDYAGTQWAPLSFYPFDLESGNPEGYINGLGIFAKDEQKPPFSVVIIDGLADAWQGKGGVLDRAGDDAQFAQWRTAKDPNFRLIEAIQKAPFHIIATVLADTQYLISTETKDGKQKMSGVSVIGTKPIQDKKIIPRFNVQCSLDEFHRLTVIRTSFSPMDRAIVERPGEDFIQPLLDWVDTGKEPDDFKVKTRAASLEQIAEYYDLQRLLGNQREDVVRAFFKKYGSRPEDCTEEFLEVRLEELREKHRPGRMVPQLQPPVTESTNGNPPVQQPTKPVPQPPQPVVSPRFAPKKPKPAPPPPETLLDAMADMMGQPRVGETDGQGKPDNTGTGQNTGQVQGGNSPDGNKSGGQSG